jgi:hypothetical protein
LPARWVCPANSRLSAAGRSAARTPLLAARREILATTLARHAQLCTGSPCPPSPREPSPPKILTSPPSCAYRAYCLLCAISARRRGGVCMPGTGSPDAVGRTLETIAAAVQPPAVPPGYRLCFPILSPTSGWLLISSSATATVRAPPTWPIFATSTPGAPGSVSGCWLCAAAISRPTPASWSKPVGVAPLLPGGWPPWPAATARRSRREHSPTPPPPTFAAPGGA